MIWPGGPEKGNSFGGYSDQQKGGLDVLRGNKVKIGKTEESRRKECHDKIK